MTDETIKKLQPLLDVVNNYVKILEASNEDLQKKLQDALLVIDKLQKEVAKNAPSYRDIQDIKDKLVHDDKPATWEYTKSKPYIADNTKITYTDTISNLEKAKKYFGDVYKSYYGK